MSGVSYGHTFVNMCRETDIESLGLEPKDEEELRAIVQNIVDDVRPVYPQGSLEFFLLLLLCRRHRQYYHHHMHDHDNHHPAAAAAAAAAGSEAAAAAALQANAFDDKNDD